MTVEIQQWNVGDRVKVAGHHYGSGLQHRLGTVLRVLEHNRVEVEMDSFYLAGIGIVTFNNEDLLITRKARKSKPRRRSRSWMS